MIVRLISGIVLLAILGVTLGSGGVILFLFTMLISIKGFLELTRAMRVRGEKESICALEWIGCIGIFFYYVILFLDKTREFHMLALVLTIMGMLLLFVLAYPKIPASQVIPAVFAFIYAPVFLSYLYQTRELEKGVFLVWLIFTSSWASDTCAYCVGVTIGKHKMAPVLSPKKSVEGGIGGVVGAALIGFLYAYCLTRFNPQALGEEIIWAFPLISACGAVLSQIGDLAASGIKRQYEIKDYGRLIPGHGGIMDRFDSVIVTAPLIYYLAMLFVKL